MEEIEKGIKHCDTCDLNVSDFSGSRKGIAPESSGCGRFNIGQVGVVRKSIHLPNFHIFSASLMSIFGMSLLANPAVAQEKVLETKQIQTSVKSVKISGTVRSVYDRSAIPFVSVKVMAGDKLVGETASTFKGTFEIKVDTIDLNFRDLQLVFMANEFEPDTIQTKTITIAMLSKGLDVELESVYDCFQSKPVEIGITGKIRQDDPVYLIAPELPEK